jgi:hypothetical protein
MLRDMKTTILDKKHSDAVSSWQTITYHGCFHLQNGCIPPPPPPPPRYNVAVSNVNKVIIMSRGGGRIYGGYFRDCATLFVFNVFVRVILSMIVAPYDCSSSETAEYDQKFIVSSGIRNGVLKN